MNKFACLLLLIALTFSPLAANSPTFYMAACTFSQRYALFTVNVYANTRGAFRVLAGVVPRLPGNNLREGIYRFPVYFNRQGFAGIEYRFQTGEVHQLTIQRDRGYCGSIVVNPPRRGRAFNQVATR